MQEFSSINVSSYDAGALAGQLSEQSRAGWSVVAIVPTGSTVTAYLSRDTDGATDHADDAPVSHEPVVAATPSPTPIQTDDQAPDDEPADVEADPAAEAPGWAAGADTETPESSDAGDHFTVADEPAAEAAPADMSAASVGTEAAPADMSAASVGAGAAPAGWYADPSSRFELRYWDGSQWTEHVSRAGQQYTDPPVA